MKEKTKDKKKERSKKKINEKIIDKTKDKPKEKSNLNRINVIRIEDDSKNAVIKIDSNSVNVIMVTNTFSRNIKMDCGKNSSTKYIEINDSENKNEINRELILQKDAALNFYSLSAGKGNQSSKTVAELKESSSLFMKNIFLLENQEHSHEIKVIHSERNSKSDLQSRGILSNSKMNLKGLIGIGEKAEESEGYQKSDMLMLNDSEAVSIPDLEIKNNNVKCSHGSSITRLDGEKIFYLQTRGLSEKDAKRVLMNAFFSTILQDLEQHETEELGTIIENKISLIAK